MPRLAAGSSETSHQDISTQQTVERTGNVGDGIVAPEVQLPPPPPPPPGIERVTAQDAGLMGNVGDDRRTTDAREEDDPLAVDERLMDDLDNRELAPPQDAELNPPPMITAQPHENMMQIDGEGEDAGNAFGGIVGDNQNLAPQRPRNAAVARIQQHENLVENDGNIRYQVHDNMVRR